MPEEGRRGIRKRIDRLPLARVSGILAEIFPNKICSRQLSTLPKAPINFFISDLRLHSEPRSRDFFPLSILVVLVKRRPDPHRRCTISFAQHLLLTKSNGIIFEAVVSKLKEKIKRIFCFFH